jgi:hypothetical protein
MLTFRDRAMRDKIFIITFRKVATENKISLYLRWGTGRQDILEFRAGALEGKTF